MNLPHKLACLALLKRKVVLIPLAVFVLLVVWVLSLQDDDDEFELQSKFPLEDYLFQNASKKEQAEIANLQQEITKLQSQLIAQEAQVKQQQDRILLGRLKDKEGNSIALDENGKPMLYDEQGNRVELESGNKVTYTQDGKKIVEDNNGNFRVYDEHGKLLAQGNSNDEEAYNRLKEQKSANRPSDYDPFVGSAYSTNPSKQESASGKSSTPQSPNDKLYYDDEGNLIGDRVALENQKFIDEKADDKQRIINDILAQRLVGAGEAKKQYQREYGVNEFSNLEDRDEASNEHKLLRTITADRMIPAFLVRPISSQIPGSAVAQVETNIYGAMGRVVLIPKGSKVIGFYQSNNKIGEYRLQIIWTRIITPQGNNILLTDAKGADVKGYNGLIGEVHTRNFERYGIPLTLSTLSNGLLLAVNSLSQKGTLEQQKSEAGNLANAYIQSQILSGMRQDVSSIIQKIVQEQIKIQPIITIKEGSRIFIAPTQDIFIPIPKKGEAMARFFTELKEKQKDSNPSQESNENYPESQAPMPQPDEKESEE